VQERKLPLRSAELYYDLSERVRLQVKAYFKLERELYFDYTHLVCRTSLKGKFDRKFNFVDFFVLLVELGGT